MKKFILILFVIFTQTLFAQWSNGQGAEYVVGQSGFTIYDTTIFSAPQNVAIDYTNNKMYVTDIGNNVVYRFAYPVSSNNPTVEVTFGTKWTSGCTQNQFNEPYGIAVHNGNLWVSDQFNNRILKFSNAYQVSSNAPNADLVIGQTNYTNSGHSATKSTFYYPSGIYIDANGNLWVADYGNNRVLEFKGVDTLTNAAAANLVLGQSSFTSSTSGTSSTTLNGPQAVAVSGTTVWVDDYTNNRVLRYDNPTSNGAAAGGVLGQSNLTSASTSGGITAGTFDYPTDIDIDAAGRLYIADESNARVLIFNNAAGKSNGGSADDVIGQFNFTTVTDTNGGQYHFYNDSSPLHNVEGVTVDVTNKKLLAVDQDNGRVLQFAASTSLPVELITFTASVIGTTVLLNWQTATEVNDNGFDVERSRKSENEGQNILWKKIGFVKGNGNDNSPENYFFQDKNPDGGNEFEYRLKQINNDGTYKYSKIVDVKILPGSFELFQNYPNPFNPTTTIKYDIPKEDHVSLKVYNEIGQKIATLVNKDETAGQYDAIFNGSKYSSGVYYYKLQAGKYSSEKKLVLLK